MADIVSKTGIPDSKSQTIGGVDMLEATLSSAAATGTAPVPKPLPQIVAQNSAADKPETKQGLSLYTLFLMSRSDEEKEILNHTTTDKIVLQLKEFVNANPSLHGLIDQKTGISVDKMLKQYDYERPASEYFSHALAAFSRTNVFEEDPSFHANSGRLWDESLDKFRIKSGFGHRHIALKGASTFHKGIDIAAPVGTDLHSEGETQVAFAGHARGYGKVVILNHGDGIYTLYGHLSGFNVRKGQHLADGQKFADSGRTGIVTNSCVHVECLVSNNGKIYAIDPQLVAKGEVDLNTKEGREKAIRMTASEQGVKIARTASGMANGLRLPAPEPSLG